jgi:hypothetical protein
MNEMVIQKLVFWCGIGHLALCIGSLAIPAALNWRANLKGVNPLTRQMFWTYAGYILAINIGFGVVSIFGNTEFTNGSFLAKSISMFIGLYWLGRIGIQFFYFDRSDAPKGFIYSVGEMMLVTLFILFAATYLGTFAFNMSWT